MRSSTSSSEAAPGPEPGGGPAAWPGGPAARAPRRFGWRGAGLTAALFVAGLAAAEVTLRAVGVVPAMGPRAVHAPTFWALCRNRLPEGDPAAVAVLGTSRMRGAFDPGVFRDRFPGRPVEQLSVSGKSPAGVLADLARTGFRGTAIVGLREETFLKSPADVAPHLAAAAAGVGPLDHFRWWLGAYAGARLSVVDRQEGPTRWLANVVKGRATATPTYEFTAWDRNQAFHFDRIDAGPIRRYWERQIVEKYGGGAPLGAWRAAAGRLAGDARRVAANGGRVVFVRMPARGRYTEVAAASFPRQLYWDRFAARRGVEAVYADDLPAVARLDCPDASHLDAADRPAFTRALLDELARRGLL